MIQDHPLYLVLISVHGLIRGHNLELGRDADTGGQTKYVVELARELAKHPQVAQVDLVTRLVDDPKVSPDYAQAIEPLSEKAQIVRLACGPRRYLRKEVLWPYLDVFADELLKYLRTVAHKPTVIHGHYADAGYVGCRVAGWLGVPLVFSGHSLGRVKRQRMLAQGAKADVIEEQFHFATRIEAEETTLGSGDLVIASTHQEIAEQYRLYDHYRPQQMVVIPPGLDISRFYPYNRDDVLPPIPIQAELERFLLEPEKPMILCLSRPVPKKNVAALVKVYGEDRELQAWANLVLVLGNRQDIAKSESGPKQVLTELLLLIDRYDLYGKVAYPKTHQADDVPELYRLAARLHGVFINPALTEPFGLTLIEAGACGLPILATADGGPRDIIAHCHNGLLFDPLNPNDIRQALHQALENPAQWQAWSAQGIAGVRQHYAWTSHVQQYLQQIRHLSTNTSISVLNPVRQLLTLAPPHPVRHRLLETDRMLISDIDNTLLGDTESLRELMSALERDENLGFGVATGRHLESAIAILDEWNVPWPDVFITSVGSEIYYGPKLTPDTSWKHHINHRWRPDLVRQAMADFPGITLQSQENQRPHKISYLVEPDIAPALTQILRHLRRLKLHVQGIYSHEQFLDLLPLRASKGDALRYFALKWNFAMGNLIVAGDSGNDEQMLMGNTLAVVVGNHSPELQKLKKHDSIYFAQAHYAGGILEGMAHYGFLEPPQKL
ncbi:HAD-IIB family hydrolase [Synechococcus sp. PCC 6312]|uniref:HAD-IIB family hydrolase n=1 Tax=Synechococcus sp. (strain ATCC 27167 / PCC 6312) TaxID=195253 RepID=UPI00029F29BA|nr:HAD-IIB family hydrolase [Synechococcus sp. PCC 6312]AFY61782.1 HAD-superfamily hydrolase, subfamily IIB [Synechococcus sp. PCC 6312]